jgi:hypothetical protein
MGKECEHEWEEIQSDDSSIIYNVNGEYVEGFGWECVFIPLGGPKEYRCNKCNSLKKGEVIFPPLPKPDKAFRISADGTKIES